MIGAKIDLLTEKHPAFARYLRRRIDVFYDTGTVSDAVLCIVSSLTASLLCSCGNDVLRYASLTAMTVIWVQASVLSGFLRQYVWIFFSAVWLMLPHLFYIAPDSLAAQQADEFQFTLSRISDELLLRPVYELSFGADPMTVSSVMLALCVILFFIGNRVRARARRSEFYCKTRLEQLK